MEPIGYYLSDVVEKGLAELLYRNGISDLVFFDKHCIYSKSGKLVFKLDDGFLECCSAVSTEENDRLHSALVASGARHSSHFVLQGWPDKFLIAKDKLIDSNTLVRAMNGRISLIVKNDNFAKFTFGNSSFLLGVRIDAFGSLTSFIALDRASYESLHASSDWAVLKSQMQQSEYCEILREMS